jgi:cell division protein FtsL
MSDWADGIETRNYGIKCKIETGMLMELIRTFVVFALVAGAFLFYSWIRIHIVSTGYEIQKLFAQEESLLRTQKALILEEETLRNPKRIDIIARNELGMSPLRPNQVIPLRVRDDGNSLSDAMALVDTKERKLEASAPLTSTAGIRTIR